MDDQSLSRWLCLREQADWRSRSDMLTKAVAAVLPQSRPVAVVDLATGEGSNLRYLIDQLPARQRWLLIDRSRALLTRGEEKTRVWASERGYEVQSHGSGLVLWGSQLECLIEMRVQDLGTLDDSSIFAGRDLVTASALLDLVSESWLRALASHCRRVAAAGLFTLTYDGRFSCEPSEPEDEMVRRGMNEHQRRDKGLGGPAEGPGAAASAARCFAGENYLVSTAVSDWALGPNEASMQRVLIEGWADAASEVYPDDAATIATWRSRRLRHVAAGQSHLIVGHRDVAAWLE
jgi:hypothetical protein